MEQMNSTKVRETRMVKGDSHILWRSPHCKPHHTNGDVRLTISQQPPQPLQMGLAATFQRSECAGFRYDKVYRKDVLAFAYECCKANGGAAGVDGQTFEDIEAYGVERWLDELAQELKSRTYQPQPVRRGYIPKPDGKQRPAGVPAIPDRTAQMTTVPGL